MIYSIFRKKGIAITTFLLFLMGTSAFAQTANAEDNDGDGVPNSVDLDDDNDGILDADEFDCTASDLIWGVPVWTGTGDPDDEAEINVTTTINDTDVTVNNTGTDFVSNAGLDVVEGTGFNGTDGLLINALADELIGTTIVYTISFDRSVTGLSFSVVDIDLNTDVLNDFIDRVTVTASNESQNITLVNGTDYTVPNPTFVDDLGGGVFQGLQLVPFSNTTDGDVIFSIDQPVDQIVIEYTNADTASFSEFTAILISDLSWSCAYRDNDNDSLADHFDTDSDGDTCPDTLEGDGGFTLADLDGDDSLGDTVNLADGIPIVAGAGQADVSSTNASVTSDECDDDGDGVINLTDGINALAPCLPVQSAGYTGYDATNAIWAAGDCDGDTVLNGDEVTAATDPYNSDTDGDGTADNLEATLAEALDPCLPVQAAGYTGYDATNAIWAAGDCDSDTILNGDEVTAATDPYNSDTDGDGTDDNIEATLAEALDPCLPVQAAGYIGYDATNAIWAAADCDSDTILNGDEVIAATDPYNTDTDGDGTADNIEATLAEALNPCLPVQAAGYTGYDGTNAIWAAGDCDSDTVLNADELIAATDPYNSDTDGDGTTDNLEATPAEALDPCLPAQAAGYTGYDATNAIWAAADCDGDSLINSLEVTNGTDPYLMVDTDGDGIDDDNETNNGTDPAAPCDPAQSAGYTGYDSANAIWMAADCDGDGVNNGEEVTNGTDPYQISGDTDGDGIDDDTETNNGTDPAAPCNPVQSAGYTGYDVANAIWITADCDGDGVNNGDEVTNGTDPYLVSGDTDGDGIDDDNEINNGTGTTDPCDPLQTEGYTGYDATNAIWAAADCDGDSITNGDEDTNGTDPYLASGDTDGDGIDDDTEVNNGTGLSDPCDPVQSAGYTGYDAVNAIWAAADCDGDSLTNSEEITLGTEIYTADTDGDTIDDGQEVSDGTNPFDDCDSVGGTPLPDTFCDRDSDGLSDDDEVSLGTDPDNPDSDGDTIEDGQEVADETDPLDPCDSDGGTPPQGTICGVEIGNSIVTPDGDGVNDTFRIENIELFANNSVEIINRWGALVFKTDNYDNNSNAFEGIANTGVSLNKGNVLPAGVYFYIIQYVDEGQSKNASGYLYINQ